MKIDDRSEWLETDGLGGFASGTASGVRTRRYHALLLTATTPPTGRMVLVNGFEASVEKENGAFALTTQRYAPDLLHPDGATRIAGFNFEPWPAWEFTLPDGTRLKHEILVEHGTGATAVGWTLLDGHAPLQLAVRPLVSGRDYHSLHHENGGFNFAAQRHDAVVTFAPYAGVPAIISLSNGDYRHAPDWYRNFLYTAELQRGLDATEDLASPGVLTWTLAKPGDRAIWILQAQLAPSDESAATGLSGASPTAISASDVEARFDRIQSEERTRRAAFAQPIDRAADAYIVRRRTGRTIVAGYPWFTDWGRDTFIAMRGLCLATKRWADARDILVEWAGAVSEGMLPNRFPDRGEAPEFNAVDASLWYVIAASELLDATRDRDTLSSSDRAAIEEAIRKIVAGYAAGTRFGIRMDEDGLLAAGVPGQQLTWMDARVGDREITPRIGKPVEVQALWLNALRIASRLGVRCADALDKGSAAFGERFWNEAAGHLSDVVDVNHVPGTRDDTFRPNQILAVGGLPFALVEGERARRIVDAAEERLLTPLGLRSLAPGEPGYAPHYEGSASARDAIYHQGTVWPWLIGPFIDAWLRIRGATPLARAEAERRFVEPLRAHLRTAGLGHVSEIADAEPPFTPRGCPFQAWSLGELLRVERMMLNGAPEGSASERLGV